ncbi:MAG: dihydropteroate synthase [Planctomycetaceae bacterium]|nr:dihydropteroate synthase [Planctomycetaceae bacterium]
MADQSPPPFSIHAGQRVLVVTGRLAAETVRQTLDRLSREIGFSYQVEVLGISVAALMHVDWVLRRLTVNEPFDCILFPGWCQGDAARLAEHYGIPCHLGPRDIRDLPALLGGKQQQVDLNAYRTEIIAEINHASRLSTVEALQIAERYRDDGTDVIDVGTVPGEQWSGVGPLVAALVREGHRVSIDSFEECEVRAAVDAGAELVLSCASRNLDWAQSLDVDWVVIPDDPSDLSTMWSTVAALQSTGRHVRVDPILEPVGFGFAASLARYFAVRRESAEIPILMGVGNVTELSEVDTAGVNFVLAAICAELNIGSILTTEVIGWSASSVAEFDIARRLATHAVAQQTLPKHLGSGLVMLHDARIHNLGDETLQQFAKDIRDPNFRIFAERGELHIMNRDGYWRGSDPFELFDQVSHDSPVEASHAFYLGYELAKAVTALTLSKQYTQDRPLNWGMLTRAETQRHRADAAEE